MKVQFTDISTAGNRYIITDDTWLTQTDLRKKRSGSCGVDAHAKKRATS